MADEAKKAAPKKPQTAYFIFCAESRSRLLEQEPDLQMTEMSKKLGTLFPVLAPVRVHVPCNLYAALVPVLGLHLYDARYPVHPGRCVHTRTQYMHTYIRRPAHKHTHAYIYAYVHIGAEWKELSEEEKEAFQAKAEADKERCAKRRARAPCAHIVFIQCSYEGGGGQGTVRQKEGKGYALTVRGLTLTLPARKGGRGGLALTLTLTFTL